MRKETRFVIWKFIISLHCGKAQQQSFMIFMVLLLAKQLPRIAGGFEQTCLVSAHYRLSYHNASGWINNYCDSVEPRLSGNPLRRSLLEFQFYKGGLRSIYHHKSSPASCDRIKSNPSPLQVLIWDLLQGAGPPPP